MKARLDSARATFAHPGTKGDASEAVWIDLFNKYLPERYSAAKCHVVDSCGAFSQQIDVAIFDRQYSPFVATIEGQYIIPAESVYAVFEAKQSANASHVEYAQVKAESVRVLHRTSLPIPSAGGELPAKVPQPILAGLLTFESDWSPPLGQPLMDALSAGDGDKRLDIGCVAAHGFFWCDAHGRHTATPGETAATAFLFELIAQLQAVATVPMIDVRAYALWLRG
ncbi:DUF6602 domain-containing protein [Hyphomicrobium denitrificans]|uniref:DUF6602 domain-containing protein n=1 Tax=Hyphomicrobium denitrificans TaxID=53399 RepID=UPI003CC915DE